MKPEHARKMPVVVAAATMAVMGAVHLASGMTTRLVRGPGGVQLENDPRLPFGTPRPEDLPLVGSGEVTLAQLVEEGRHRWFHEAQLEGEPFGVPEALFDLYFSGFQGRQRDRMIAMMENAARTGLMHVPGEDLPRGLVRTQQEPRLVTQNCSACHSGEVQGHLIPGVGNKWYNQKAIIQGARQLMRASIPWLLLQGEAGKPLLQQTRRQLAKLERYESLYQEGCADLAPGMITAARIWEISSKLLHDPAQLTVQDGTLRFMCGATKPPPLNTLRFKNLLFWDGSVNTLWVAHWPMFDFFGFDNYQRWETKVQSREIQAIDAFTVFGTESPSWEQVMGTPIRGDMARRGYRIFHQPNSCASCHGTHGADGMLRSYRPRITPLQEIRTDGERAYAAFDDLMNQFAKYGWAHVPRLTNAAEYGFGYIPNPLCSPFLNFPYLHTASVGTLYELLLPEEKRSTSYVQSDVMDMVKVGYYRTGEFPRPPARFMPRPPRILSRWFDPRKVRGHSGLRFGTHLDEAARWDLLEYLKTLRCPEEPDAHAPVVSSTR